MIQKLVYRLPKYLVLQVDMVMCIISVLVAYLLRYNLETLPQEVLDSFYISLGVICSVKLMSFLYFKSYTGIIRYTSIEDAKRIFYSLTVSLLAVLAINFAYFYFYNTFVVHLSILIIDYFTSSLFMAGFRDRKSVV